MTTVRLKTTMVPKKNRRSPDGNAPYVFDHQLNDHRLKAGGLK
jgi:hypothetical protein